MKVKDWGERRWYVNGQGQTFAVIEGPVEFDMGSPPGEPERFGDEILHRVQISRRFALAAKEVTVEQYHQFVKETPEDDHAKNDRYSPDPKGPMNNVSWYDAAAYCNWLSQKENLPECYEPNERGKYAAGMRIKTGALKLPGYRLPTEVEWEYACRSGAATSRYHGSSIDLLGRYAHYSRRHYTRVERSSCATPAKRQGRNAPTSRGALSRLLPSRGHPTASERAFGRRTWPPPAHADAPVARQPGMGGGDPRGPRGGAKLSKHPLRSPLLRSGCPAPARPAR